MNAKHFWHTTALTVGLWLSAAGGYAQTTMIYPRSGSGGDHVIAVVSDGYTAKEEWKFNRAVNGLVLNGLMADPYYKERGSKFTIMKVFTPVNYSGDSAFGFTINYDSKGCFAIDQKEATTTAIVNKVDGLWPSQPTLLPTHYIVIGNHEGVSFGCRNGIQSYVTAGAREAGGVLEHEFGHLIATLGDEYALDGYETYAENGVPPNCADEKDRLPKEPPVEWPHWMAPLRQLQLIRPTIELPDNPQGCAYRSKGIVRPYHNKCRMRGTGADFCLVCQHYLDDALEWPPAPPTYTTNTRPDRLAIVHAAFVTQTPAPLQQTAAPRTDLIPAVRMIVELSSDPEHAEQPEPARPAGPSGKRPRVLTVADASAPRVRSQRRTGDLAYQVIEEHANGQVDILETASVPGDPLQSRVYGNGGAHRIAPAVTASVVVTIPNMTTADLRTRSIRLRFYQLRSSPSWNRGEVTTDNIKGLLAEKQPLLCELSPTDLKEALGNLVGKQDPYGKRDRKPDVKQDPKVRQDPDPRQDPKTKQGPKRDVRQLG